jgi:hypothetical protein
VRELSRLWLLVLGADDAGWIAKIDEVIGEPIVLVSGRDSQDTNHFLTSVMSSSSTQSNWVKLEVSELCSLS